MCTSSFHAVKRLPKPYGARHKALLRFCRYAEPLRVDLYPNISNTLKRGYPALSAALKKGASLPLSLKNNCISTDSTVPKKADICEGH